MNNLFEFEYTKASQIDLCVNCSTLKDKCQCSAISLSSKIVACLDAKVKSHNSENNKRVSLAQLKSLLIRAEELWKNEVNSTIPLLEYSLAYLNSYLKAIENNLTGIAKRLNKTSLPLSEMRLQILDEDFASAKRDIVAFKLDNSCKTFLNLYLDDEQELKKQILARLDSLI
jgi:hypothetical protein